MASPAAAPSPWDAHAAVYEQVWERSTSLYGRDALVLGGLAPGSTTRLLDVACGAGDLALAAAALGYEVTATDLSAGMIARLQHKITASPSAVGSKITPRVVDGQTLDGLRDESFDVVSSVFGIFLFPDRVAAWRSVLRVLVPGGRLLAASWDANSVNVRMVRYLMENAQDKTAAVAPDSPLQHVLAPAINRTVFAASFREELAECGYEDIAIHTVSHPMCFRSGEELVLGVLDNSAFVAMTGGKTRESLQRCILDYAQLVLDGVDPFAEDASATAAAFCEGGVETHPLWSRAFALQGTGHIAVATKASR